MSSAGHIADMIVRMENNRALLKHHRHYKDIIELHATKSLKKPLVWRSLSDSERQLLLEHLHQVLRQERRNTTKAIILSLIITTSIILILAAVFRWVFM